MVGTTELGLFSTGQSGDGFQAGHWKRLQESIGNHGPNAGLTRKRLSLTELDLQALDALGYEVNYGALNNLNFNALLQETESSNTNKL